jgi:hypothetical protein
MLADILAVENARLDGFEHPATLHVLSDFSKITTSAAHAGLTPL